MQQQYDYSKFNEYLQLKGYSKETIATTINTVTYFTKWATGENITEIEELSYSEALGFIQWSSKHGASQKTVANYLLHVRKFYDFLVSEKQIETNPVAHIKVQGIKRKVYYNILTPEELQQLYHEYPTTIEHEAGKIIPPQERNILCRKRNKIIVSLLVHQGLRTEELAAIMLQDLQLREGTITIQKKRRTAARTMRLESHQVYELMDYLHVARKEYLQLRKKHNPALEETDDKLFVQWFKAEKFHNITQMLLQHLRKINSKVKNVDQIRASVITAWLKQYDLRKVQYLAGHKYVSSTEEYKENLIDELQDDVTKFHPL